MRHRYLLIGCLLSLGGCSTSPVNLQSDYEATAPSPPSGGVYTQSRRVAAMAVSVRCGVFLESLQDQRADKNNMGNIAGSPVHAANMLEWMDSGIGTLSASGYRIDKSPHDDAVIMDVELLKAYMISIATSKSANMVVRVRYKHPDGSTLATQVYRGVDISVDWVGGEGEMNSAFQRSTKQVLDKMSGDLDNYCQAPISTAAR